MAAFLRSMRQGFNRQPEASSSTNSTAHRNDADQLLPSPTSPGAMSGTTSPASFSNASHASGENGYFNSEPQPVMTDTSKFFFREKYAKLGVKGNFMPLAAQPVNVDLADWLAHQTVENYRLVSTIASCVQEIDSHTGKAICNSTTCPRMTAGRHTYTWLDNNRNPVPVSAFQYISLVQRWMDGKITDPRAFPTDAPGGSPSTYASGSASTPAMEAPIAVGPTNLDTSLSNLTGKDWIGKEAGFPETFFGDCRTCFRQIFRIYAHLYHSHWIDPFWHLSSGSNSQGWTDLNSCFVHFCTVAKLYGILSDKDAEPMQPLIDIWIANGSIPAEAANSTHAVVPPA